MSRTIEVVNHSTVLTDTQARTIMAVLQLQVDHDFGPAWNIGCTLMYRPPGPKDWTLNFFDDSDQAGVLGYHSLTAGDVPYGRVFAKTDLDNKLAPSVTASHELLEMLADPWINLAVQTGRSQFHAVEVGDPVEADTLGYQINSVQVSDFVLPAWYQPGAPGPYDFKRHVKHPLGLTKGGYASVWTAAHGWSQTGAAHADADGQPRYRRRG